MRNGAAIGVARRDADEVLAAQTDLVDVVHTLIQVVCVKGYWPRFHIEWHNQLVTHHYHGCRPIAHNTVRLYQ